MKLRIFMGDVARLHLASVGQGVEYAISHFLQMLKTYLLTQEGTAAATTSFSEAERDTNLVLLFEIHSQITTIL